MKWFKWPFQFRFSINFSIGEQAYEPEPLAERALRMATDRNPADALSADAATHQAEIYLKYLEAHK